MRPMHGQFTIREVGGLATTFLISSNVDRALEHPLYWEISNYLKNVTYIAFDDELNGRWP